jgi:hypothetical protein
MTNQSLNPCHLDDVLAEHHHLRQLVDRIEATLHHPADGCSPGTRALAHTA